MLVVVELYKWKWFAYQSDEQEEHQERSAKYRYAKDITIADSWHGYDEKINARPVGQLLGVAELQRIAWIFQLPKNHVILNNFQKYILFNIFLTKCIIPAAVNHTDIKMETNCANRIELDVFNTFKYCKISGTVIRRSALRKRRPGLKINLWTEKAMTWVDLPIQVRCKYMDTKDGGIVK